MKLVLSAVAFAAALFAVPAAYAQTTYSYQPNPADMNDFDHHSVYSWNVKPTQFDSAMTSVTGGTLTFTNIANWKAEANVMHLWLFDTSVYSGVKSFYDDKTSNSNVTDLTDDFSNARYHNGVDANGSKAPWLIADGTKGISLDSGALSVSSGYWSYDAAHTGWQDGNASNNWADATKAKTVTFTFSNAAISTLNSYLANGGDFALGFDPDCHYFNDGVTLSLNTAPKTGPAAVPEPGLLTFLATGGMPIAFGLVRARRRKAA